MRAAAEVAVIVSATIQTVAAVSLGWWIMRRRRVHLELDTDGP